ncbi:MAG: hypothetical protein JJT90_10635 [Ectothiorhodospiraceae bacterium]|nr:hypothetical protein [Ectothiorhodospiraceae bacterium]
MNWKSYIPDDWRRAVEAIQDMRSVDRKTSHPYAKGLISLTAPLLVVASIVFMWNPKMPESVALASITALSILGGFIINLMLFTGRMGDAQGISADDSRIVASHISYLLVSQSTTFFVYLITLVMAISWFAFASAENAFVNSISISLRMATALLIGLLFVCFMRSTILPLQLYEMHRFTLDLMVATKDKELSELIDKEKRKEEKERLKK